jgi:DNA polymerase-3 subunit beta
MRIKTSELKQAVKRIEKAVAQRPILPILAYIKIKSEDNKLFVFATNLELSLKSNISEVQDLKDIDICIPAKPFLSLLVNLHDCEYIDINQNSDNYLIIKANKSKFTLKTLPTKDFPEFEEPNNLFEIDNNIYKHLLNAIKFCSNDNSKNILQGVKFSSTNGILDIAGTDGYRLYWYEVPSNYNNFDLLIDRNSCNELANMIKSFNSVKLEAKERLIIATSNEMYLSSKIIEGQYPRYKSLIPTDFSKTIKINRKELLDSLKLCSVINFDKLQLVTLELSDKELKVFSISIENGTSEAILNCEKIVIDRSLTITFNLRFLSEALEVFESEFVNISFNTELSPCVISSEIDKQKAMIMPIRN